MQKENSAVRNTAAGQNFDLGATLAKSESLASLPLELAAGHVSGLYHIHDLDNFEMVNNCSTPLPAAVFHPEALRAKTDAGKISELVEQFKRMCCRLCHQQSGGIGSANFDVELAEALCAADVAPSEENASYLHEALSLFIVFISTQRVRYARENIYLTLNLGLDTTAWGRIVTRELILAFQELPMDCTRPNIVFKVAAEVNGEGAPNHDLFLAACACTAKKMIPTYLLCDAAPNKACDSKRLSIMGCRTRVYANRNGDEGSWGRGNVAAVSINLVRLALATKDEAGFMAGLDSAMADAKRVLLLRRESLLRSIYVKELVASGMWAAKDVVEMLRTGTYSIGFIGLAEACEILGFGKLAESEVARSAALRIVRHMRTRTDAFAAETGLNFSLLASAGEGISGRFPELDAKHYPEASRWWGKGYYSNSFHVPVDSGAGLFKKLEVEGPFHALANGGSISYIEMREAPIGNPEAIADAVAYAERCGVSYFGVNYPLDVCKKCGRVGTFDTCPQCGSVEINRIRRVSGYLEQLDEFSSGKRAEEAHRRANYLEVE